MSGSRDKSDRMILVPDWKSRTPSAPESWRDKADVALVYAGATIVTAGLLTDAARRLYVAAAWLTGS